MEKFKLDLACTKDDTRPAMNHIFVTPKVCVATDANVLVVVPTHMIFNYDFAKNVPDEGILIHREDWKKLLSYDVVYWKNEIKGNIIEAVSSKKRKLIIEAETQEKVGKFPNWEAVIPSEEMTKNISTIGLNFEKALTVQKALNFESCKLVFTDSLRPILVYSRDNSINDRSEPYGIVMPVMTL